ncbi:hypothetical protein [Halorubellus litoreus]|uniref:Uncharacterized protein n=1 Tax=Halorubellus litoreus TaxID=755308 RepID=A0ABD5VL27_9EURY
MSEDDLAGHNSPATTRDASLTDACSLYDAGPEALYRRAPGFSRSQRSVDPDKGWYRRDCQQGFDDLEGRERGHPGGFNQGSLAARLDQTITIEHHTTTPPTTHSHPGPHTLGGDRS